MLKQLFNGGIARIKARRKLLFGALQARLPQAGVQLPPERALQESTGATAELHGRAGAISAQSRMT